MSRNKLIILLLMFSFNFHSQPLSTVDSVDLNRYAGKWYEIASFPQSFQKGCHCTTAEYTPTEKGYIIVENRCNRDSVSGKESYIKGKAFIKKNSGNAKLLVQFFWPFKADYWIIDLDKNYEYAVVGHPGRNYLWILSRNPEMNEDLYSKIVARAAEKGFDVNKLVKTVQRKN